VDVAGGAPAGISAATPVMVVAVAAEIAGR